MVQGKPTFSQLHEKLAIDGGNDLVDVLENLEASLANAVKQDLKDLSLARKLTKEDARIEWQWTSDQILRRNRAIGEIVI